MQGYGIHRAENRGDKDAYVWSLRVLDASKPEYYLVALKPYAEQFVNLGNGNNLAVVNVVPKYGSYDPREEAFALGHPQSDHPEHPGPRRHPGTYIGGDTANFQDFHSKLYSRFPYIVAAVLILTFFVLMMFFQSVFLPLKAILMNHRRPRSSPPTACS